MGNEHKRELHYAFIEKCNKGYYRCRLPFGAQGSSERQEYGVQQKKLNEEFNADLRAYLLDVNVPERYVDRVAAIAYEEGHSGGYSEILCEAQTLAGIFS